MKDGPDCLFRTSGYCHSKPLQCSIPGKEKTNENCSEKRTKILLQNVSSGQADPSMRSNTRDEFKPWANDDVERL
jgi:hypothetical protein